MLSNTINKNSLYDSKYFNSFSNVSCESEAKWLFGQKFMNNLKNSNFTGLTGQIEFNKETGLRTRLKLSIGDKIKNSIVLVSIIVVLKKNILYFFFLKFRLVTGETNRLIQ
jgi:hypothetical protein